MPRYQSQSISPIKMLNSTKPYETPAKYLTQRNQTIYEQEYYKEKAQRLQNVVKDLKEEIRILETQNKQLKTQIQIYRDSAQSKTISQQRKHQQTSQPDQVHRLLKQIRQLKNSHEMQLNQNKTEQKRLNKRILQLQAQIHQNQLSWQSKCQQTQSKIQQKNKLLEKEVKELRKSVILYMEQRDDFEQKLEKLKGILEEKQRQVNEVQQRERQVMEEKVLLEEKLNQLIDNRKQHTLMDEIQNESSNQSENQKIYNEPKASRRRQELYEFGVNSIKRTASKQSTLPIQTFYGTGHVPAEQAFQIFQSFKSEIHRLQNELQRNSLLHVKESDDFNYLIQRYERELKEKDNDIVNLLTKVKPLMLQKNKMTTKENVSPSKKNKPSFQQDRQNVGKNAFGLKMLDMFLKKYKMQAF